MNIVKVVKGNDVKLSVDDKILCFVTDFTAKENTQCYEIKEMLSDECVDTINKKKTYTLCIKAFSHFDSSVLRKSSFTLKVECDAFSYEYLFCNLKSCEKEVTQNKPLIYSYIIDAKEMRGEHDE